MELPFRMEVSTFNKLEILNNYCRMSDLAKK